MADGFDDAAKKAAGLAISQVPVIGFVAEVVQTFLPPNADERLRRAVQEDLEQTVARVQRRVEELAAELARQGKKLDELGAVRTAALARELAQATTDARSPEKTTALVNAAARQFDPRAGTASVREYWLRRVRALPDIELEVVRLVHAHERVAFNGAIFSVSKTSGVWIGKRVGEPPRSDVVGLEVTALAMSKGSEPEQLLLRDHTQVSLPMVGDKYENFTTSLFGLTPSGEELAKFISD